MLSKIRASATIYISPEPEQAIKQSWCLGNTSLLNRHRYQEWWEAVGLAAFLGDSLYDVME